MATINVCIDNSDKKLEVTIEPRPNGDLRSFHTNFDLHPTHPNQTFFLPVRKEGAWWNGLGEKEKELLACLSTIDGLTNALLCRYQVCIEKAYMFTWDNIVPQVKKVFLDVYGKDILICDSKSPYHRC
jgi:hypothetical protein